MAMGTWFSSPKTTISGIIEIVWGCYNIYLGNIPIAITSLTSGFGHVFARDNTTTSEEAGAK